MELTVNGERRVLEGEVSVQALLDLLGANPSHVAVERNREIVAREAFAETHLSDGDTLEVVRFMCGG